MAFSDELNTLDTDNLLGLEEEEEALEESYAPSVIPPSIPSLGNLGNIAPPEFGVAQERPGIQKTPKIAKPETRAGIVPTEEPLSFTNIYPTEFVEAPLGRGVVPEDVTFEPARVTTLEGAAKPKGIISPEVLYAEEPQGITADVLNKMSNLETSFFGETRETQKNTQDLFRPSYQPKEAVDEEPAREKPTWGQEFWRAPGYGLAQVVDLGGGLVSLLGHGLRSEAIKSVGKGIHDKVAPYLELYRPGIDNWRDIKGADDLARYVVSGVLQQIPFMIASLGTGSIISAVLKKGVQAGLAKGLMTTVAGKAAKKAGEAALSKGFTLGQSQIFGRLAGRQGQAALLSKIGQTSASTILEAGIISADATREGIDPFSLNLLWAIPAGFADSFMGWKFAEKLNLIGEGVVDITRREGVKAGRSAWRKALGDFVRGIAIEGPTESLQEMLEQFGTGNYKIDATLLDRMVNAGIQGSLAGGFMNMGFGLFEKPNNLQVDEKTGMPAKPFIIPAFAEFAVKWDAFRKGFEPKIVSPLLGTAVVDQEGKPTGELVYQEREWDFVYQQMSDIMSGREPVPKGEAQLAREATEREKQRQAAWSDIILNAVIKEPGDINKLPDDIQRAWSKFWSDFKYEKGQYGPAHAFQQMEWQEFLDSFYTAVSPQPVGWEKQHSGYREGELQDIQYPSDITSYYNKTVFGITNNTFVEKHFGKLPDRLALLDETGPDGEGKGVASIFNGGDIVDGQIELRTISGGRLTTYYDEKAKDKKRPFSAVKYTNRDGKEYYGKDMMSVLMKEKEDYLSIRESFLGDTILAEPPPRPTPGRPGALSAYDVAGTDPTQFPVGKERNNAFERRANAAAEVSRSLKRGDVIILPDGGKWTVLSNSDLGVEVQGEGGNVQVFKHKDFAGNFIPNSEGKRATIGRPGALPTVGETVSWTDPGTGAVLSGIFSEVDTDTGKYIVGDISGVKGAPIQYIDPALILRPEEPGRVSGRKGYAPSRWPLEQVLRTIKKAREGGKLTAKERIIYESTRLAGIQKGEIWKGTAYRAATGYRHDIGATAADVVNYEQKELGNKLGVSREVISELKNHPAANLIWVGKTEAAVKRYGGPEKIDLPPGSRIIANDGEGGYLVLKGGLSKATTIERPFEPRDPWNTAGFTNVADRVGASPRMTFDMALGTWEEQKKIGLTENMEDASKKQYLKEVVYSFINKKLNRENRSLVSQEVEQFFNRGVRAPLEGEPRSWEEYPEANLPTAEEIKNFQAPGFKITQPFLTYRNGESGKGNVYVRQGVSNSNEGSTLLVQISDQLINPVRSTPSMDRAYYDKLYGKKPDGTPVRRGFNRLTDMWEFPHWMGIASNSLDNVDIYVVRNVDEAVQFLKEARYGKVAFSVLEVNKNFVKDVIRDYEGEVVLGGYIDLAKEFGGFKNVKTYGTLQSFIRSEGKTYRGGTNYRHFQDSRAIPRLALTYGCRSKCLFCDVKPHGKVVQFSERDIRRQVDSIKKTFPRGDYVVYINDKTFGEGSNFALLQSIRTELKAANPDFQGFVIQTTATQLNKLSDQFLANSGIKYVEIGVESFNDSILAKYRKPHRTKHITEAFEKIRRNKILAIPNIIVGIKEETQATYQNTLAFILGNKDVISHINVYNLAVYPGTELESVLGSVEPGDMNENEAKKSWMKEPEMHSAFAKRLFEVASEQLDINEDDLLSGTARPARTGRIPGFLPATVAVTSEGVSVYAMGETHGQNLPPDVLARLTNAKKGWVDPDGFYTEEMASRKRAGIDVKPIPIKDIEALSSEGFLSDWIRLIEPVSGRKIGADASVRFIGDRVSGRDIDTGRIVEGTVKEHDPTTGIIEIGLDNGSVVRSRVGEVKKVEVSGEWKLPPLQPIDEAAPGKQLDEAKLAEYYYKYGDEEISERIGQDVGKGRGLWKVTFADGHAELVEASSKYEATQKAKPLYPRKTTIDALLINREPSGRRLGVLKGQEKAVSVIQINKMISDLSFALPRDVVRFKAFNSWSELSSIEKQDLRRLSSTDKAAIDRKPPDGGSPIIYFFAENHTDMDDVKRSSFHELIGHLGFEKAFGPVRTAWIASEVHKIYPWEQMQHIYMAYGFNPNEPTGRYQAAMEKISEISETLENPGLWRRFVAWFKEQVHDIFGVDFRLTEDDIRAFLWRSRNLMMSEFVQSEVEVYNNMIDQTVYGDLDLGLPLGPLEISARADTNFSDIDPGENEKGWRAYYEARKLKREGFVRKTEQGVWEDVDFVKDLGMVEAFASLPVWIGMRHPGFKWITDVEWDRADKRNRDRLWLLRNPDTNTGDNPYTILKNTSNIDKLLIWSDQNDSFIGDEQELQAKAKELFHIKLTKEEVLAYFGWKKGFDRSVDYAIKKLTETTMALYGDRPWGQVLKGYYDKTISMEQALAGFPDEATRKDFLSAIKLTDSRLESIAKKEKQLRSMNFYVPHVRGNGPFAVRVFYTDNTQLDEKTGRPKEIIIWAERYRKATDVELARQKLVKAFPGLRVVKIQETEITEFTYGAIKVPMMEEFLSEATERIKREGKIEPEVADKLLNEVFKNIDEMIMARGFRQHYIQRHRPNIIRGFQATGLKEVFHDYMSGLAGSMTKLEATYDFHKALQKIIPLRQKGLYEYAVRYVDNMLRNSDSLDRKLTGLKVIPYTWYLSMNLRLAATQGFQNLITAYPILARLQAENGIKGPAWYRLGKAMSDFSVGNLTKEEEHMLLTAHEEGETMANAIKEMKGRMEGGWAKKYSQKLVDVISLPFSWMEKFNRKTSLLAAFRMYKEAGKSYDESYYGAKEFVRLSHYAYGLSNYPQLLRDGTPFSKVAGMAYVFKSFPHNYVLSMLHFAKDKEGKLALGVMMRSLAMIFLLGGMAALPFLDDIFEAYEKLTGHFVRSEVRNTLRKFGGDALANVGMEGVPALAGIDMSGSVKMALPVPGLSFDPGTFTMGVWGGLIDKGYKTFDYAINGDFARALESGLPTGGELIMKAIRQQQEGIRTMQGREILDERGQPIKPTKYEAGVQMAGFRPHRVSVIQKERRTAQNVLEHYSKVRQEIRRDLRIASARGDMAALEKIRQQIQIYNLGVMKYRGVVPRFEGIRETFRPETGYMKSRRIFEEEEEEE